MTALPLSDALPGRAASRPLVTRPASLGGWRLSSHQSGHSQQMVGSSQPPPPPRLDAATGRP